MSMAKLNSARKDSRYSAGKMIEMIPSEVYRIIITITMTIFYCFPEWLPCIKWALGTPILKAGSLGHIFSKEFVKYYDLFTNIQLIMIGHK